MATEVIHTLRSSGGDYTSFAAWDAAEQRNLVSADEVEILECYNDWTGNGLHTNFFDLEWGDGYTDATRNIIIRSTSGHGPNGIPNSGFRCYSDGTGQVLEIVQPYTLVQNIQLKNIDDGAGSNYAVSVANETPGVILDGVIGESSDIVFDINLPGSGEVVTLRNCYARPVGPNREPTGFLLEGAGSGEVHAYNCVAGSGQTGWACSNGFIGDDESIAVNCVAYNCGTGFDGIWATGSSNNASDDSSHPGSGGVAVSSSDFVDAANDDFHLSASSNLTNAGANLYSIFTYDIDGDEYPSTGDWPIGFDYRAVIHEAAITFGSELYSITDNDAILAASIVYINNLGDSNSANSILETSTIFSKSLSYIGESRNILDVAVVFSNELSSFYQDNVVFEAASNFLNSLSYSNNGGIVLDTSVDFNIVESDQFSSDVTFETAVSLSNLLANLFSTGNIFDSEVSFEMLQSVQATVSAILEAATIYSNAQGISEGNIASLNAVQDFGITQSVLLNSVADLSSDISFDISEDFIVDGELITSGIVDAYTVLAINQGIESQIGSTTYSPKLDVGIVQSIDSLTIANLFASSVFGSQLIFSTNGGNLIEAAISYGIVQQNIQSIEISIEGAVQFGIGQALSGNGQAELNGAIALSHQAAIQSIAQSVLDANLPLSCIQGIDVEGSLALLSLELPCGRSIKVRIESRSVSVQSENRTISVEPENRTISAQPENRNTTIRGCN